MTDQGTRLGSRAVLNSTYVLAARTVSRLVALVVVIQLANHLGAARYGEYTTYIAYSSLISVLVDMGLSPLYTREAAREPDRLSAFLAMLLSGKVVLAVLATVALAVALAAVGLKSLIIPGAVLLVVTSYANLLRNTFYARGRLGFEAIAILCETAIQAGLIIAGAHLGQDVTYFVWAYAASFGFTCLYCLVVIPAFGLGRIGFHFDLGLFRSWLRVAFPFAVAFFLTNLYFRADVPILEHFRSFSEVGWYTFAYKPFEALQFIPLAVAAVVYPLLGVYFREKSDRLAPTYQHLFKVLFVVGWPLTVGTFVLVRPVGHLFRLYPESIPSLRILSLAIVFLFVNSAFTSMLNAIDRQNRFAWATAIAVVVNVVLNLALIPRFGYLAASATTVVTEIAFGTAAWTFIAPVHRLDVIRTTWRTVLAGLVMGLVLYPLAGRSIFVSAPLGGVTFLVALFALRAVDRSEVELLLRGFRPGR